MKGAVQGVATITASTPVKKEPERPDRPASAPPIPAKRPRISNRPAKFSPISTMRYGHEQDEDRLLELEAPAGRLPGAAHRQQHRADDGEARQDADGIGRPVPGHAAAFAPIRMGVAGETQGLHREHGQHAGHQVQDQAAEQGENDGLPEADRKGRGGLGCCEPEGLGGDLAVAQPFLDDQQAADLGNRFRRLAALRLQGERPVRHRERLRRGIFHDAVAVGIEPGVPR